MSLTGQTSLSSVTLEVNASTKFLTLQGTFDGDATETMVVTDATLRTVCSTAFSGPTQIVFSGSNWTCQPNVATLPDGTNTLTATATDLAGNTTSSAPLTFDKDTVAPTAPTLAPVTQFTNQLATEPVYTGSAEAGTTITIYNTGNNTVLCTTTADPSGQFACRQLDGSPSDLAAGGYTIDATATDAAQTRARHRQW